MFNHFINVFKKYADFRGRSSRAEYWSFIGVTILISIASTVVQVAFPEYRNVVSIIIPLYQLAALIPSLAVAVRRMHDVDKSGWFILVPIYNLVLALTPGTVGPNRFDPVTQPQPQPQVNPLNMTTAMPSAVPVSTPQTPQFASQTPTLPGNPESSQ